jgi:hypothetical protein
MVHAFSKLKDKTSSKKSICTIFLQIIKHPEIFVQKHHIHAEISSTSNNIRTHANTTVAAGLASSQFRHDGEVGAAHVHFYLNNSGPIITKITNFK